MAWISLILLTLALWGACGGVIAARAALSTLRTTLVVHLFAAAAFAFAAAAAHRACGAGLRRLRTGCGHDGPDRRARRAGGRPVVRAQLRDVPQRAGNLDSLRGDLSGELGGRTVRLTASGRLDEPSASAGRQRQLLLVRRDLAPRAVDQRGAQGSPSRAIAPPLAPARRWRATDQPHWVSARNGSRRSTPSGLANIRVARAAPARGNRAAPADRRRSGA